MIENAPGPSPKLALAALGACVGIWTWVVLVVPGFVAGLVGGTLALLTLAIGATGPSVDVNPRSTFVFGAWLAATLLGPPLGFLVGSGVLVAYAADDWWPRFLIRALVAGALPLVLLPFAIGRLSKRTFGTVVCMIALVGLAASSAARSAYDVANGALAVEDRARAVTFHSGGYGVELDAGTFGFDPHRLDVRRGERGRATLLRGSEALVDWKPVARRELAPAETALDVEGEGFGSTGSAVALIALESVFAIAAAIALLRRAGGRGYYAALAGLAVVVPICLFPSYLVLTAFGHAVDATVIDRASSGTNYRGRTTYSYSVRAISRDTDGHELPLEDALDATTYKKLEVGSGVRFVIAPFYPSIHQLGTPQIGFAWLIVMITALATVIPSAFLGSSKPPRDHITGV